MASLVDLISLVETPLQTSLLVLLLAAMPTTPLLAQRCSPLITFTMPSVKTDINPPRAVALVVDSPRVSAHPASTDVKLPLTTIMLPVMGLELPPYTKLDTPDPVLPV
ncbi:unnamed protein product [Phytophthora fragariaefolia]|uniref:Unnamed protein product n=1 Tax=Phytophthora fragariaefolia TaxID=1490495 RepID=A0A9W6TSR6_9STRA|nr:unnamed protein product [Phytophthora fragariaefolia]